MINFLLISLSIIYAVLGIILFFESRHMSYGKITSTMMGLLFPSVLLFETTIKVFLTIVNYVYHYFMSLVLILCGTDREEFQTKMIEHILSEKE